jgi:hypothetical protein
MAGVCDLLAVTCLKFYRDSILLVHWQRSLAMVSHPSPLFGTKHEENGMGDDSNTVSYST